MVRIKLSISLSPSFFLSPPSCLDRAERYSALGTGTSRFQAEFSSEPSPYIVPNPCHTCVRIFIVSAVTVDKQHRKVNNIEVGEDHTPALCFAWNKLSAVQHFQSPSPPVPAARMVYPARPVGKV